MHLNAHFKDCILDFGPISAFWAFPFDRFLKNWIKPEEQIIRKFLSFQELMTMQKVPKFRFRCVQDYFLWITTTHKKQSLLFAMCDTCHINAEYLDLLGNNLRSISVKVT